MSAKRYRAGELMVEGMETSLLLDGDEGWASLLSRFAFRFIGFLYL